MCSLSFHFNINSLKPDCLKCLNQDFFLPEERDPDHETLLALSTDDGRLIVWDLNGNFTLDIGAKNVLTFLFFCFVKLNIGTLISLHIDLYISLCNIWLPRRLRKIGKALEILLIFTNCKNLLLIFGRTFY